MRIDLRKTPKARFYKLLPCGWYLCRVQLLEVNDPRAQVLLTVLTGEYRDCDIRDFWSFSFNENAQRRLALILSEVLYLDDEAAYDFDTGDL